mmetsp:Transcript_61692/g.175237  ORF Transcript_61692/g.175237 Transcript_61692/m.175237 type:complete len:203 (+) Transcript_61692:173-781(+)
MKSFSRQWSRPANKTQKPILILKNHASTHASVDAFMFCTCSASVTRSPCSSTTGLSESIRFVMDSLRVACCQFKSNISLPKETRVTKIEASIWPSIRCHQGWSCRIRLRLRAKIEACTSSIKKRSKNVKTQSRRVIRTVSRSRMSDVRIHSPSLSALLRTQETLWSTIVVIRLTKATCFRTSAWWTWCLLPFLDLRYAQMVR